VKVLRVPVLGRDGTPLTPCRPDRARVLLKRGKAKPVWLPGGIFALQLTYRLENPVVVPLVAGIDTGSKTAALSLVLPRKRRPHQEVLSVQVPLPGEAVRHRLRERRNYRRLRRYRKGYRKPRFRNRNPSPCWVCGRNARPGKDTCRRHAGVPRPGYPARLPRLAPSSRARWEAYLRVLGRVREFLPVGAVAVELGRFDLQKLRDPGIAGEAYQKGPRYGYEHLRAALAAEYGSRCAYCGQELPVSALEADHVISKSRGGSDAWENRLLACKPCNDAKGGRTPEEWGVRPRVEPRPLHRTRLFLHATRAQQGKGYLLGRLREEGLAVRATYGYRTAWVRKALGLTKGHRTDARVIALACLGSDEEVPRPVEEGAQVLAVLVPARVRQRFKAQPVREGERPAHAARFPQGWLIPREVNAAVEVGTGRAVPAGGRRGYPRRELVVKGDWVVGRRGQGVVVKLRTRGRVGLAWLGVERELSPRGLRYRFYRRGLWLVPLSG